MPFLRFLLLQKVPAIIKSYTEATLFPQDLITYETRLKDALLKFFKFKAYSLYFPSGSSPSLKWIKEEKKLLLPITLNKKCLAVFSASEAEINENVLSLLPYISELCAENLLLYKKSLLSPLTGLYNKHFLLDKISASVSNLRGSLGFGLAIKSESDSSNEEASCFGILVVNFGPLRSAARQYSYSFMEDFLRALSLTLQKCVPEKAFAAECSDFSFAVFLPVSGPLECARLGKELASCLEKVTVAAPLTGSKVSIPVSVGYAFYPQDAEESYPQPDSDEQARILLRRAQLAALRAWDAQRGPLVGPLAGKNALPEESSPVKVLGFREIPERGGKITETFSADRVRINLGLATGAREGQHYLVFEPDYSQRLPKGEVVLLETQETSSLAEVVFIADLANPLAASDLLTLVAPNFYLQTQQEELAAQPTGSMGSEAAENSDAKEAPNKLLLHKEFMSRFATSKEEHTSFSLALIRFSIQEDMPQSFVNNDGAPLEALENASQQFLEGTSFESTSFIEETCTRAAVFCHENLPTGSFGARYGYHSLIYFMPEADGEKLEKVFENLCLQMEESLPLLPIKAVVGIASHPFLHYRKSDILDNLGKAFDYALLLGQPQVGLLGSLALNIRADRHFSQGDTFAAITEYKTALLADETNATAWTSLGVSFAGIDNHTEAERCFTEALKHDAANLTAAYNLAKACQLLGNVSEAAKAYKRCLELQPEHVYALLRLGQLSESAADYEAAKEYYLQAAERSGGEGPAARHLARLALSQGQKSEARERLHQALGQNPEDPLSLGMLAGIYLDEGDSASVALSLARQSVSLRPDYRMGWLNLARALETAGDAAGAQKARLMAANL